MTDLEKLRKWISTYPGYDILNEFQCDYTDQIPGFGGVFPAGLVEVGRHENLFGDITVSNQYNYGLYCVMAKSPGDDAGATVNADWVMDFQNWVQGQSVTHKAPTFGDEPCTESIKAQNGALFDADGAGTATYMIQISVTFKRNYKE